MSEENLALVRRGFDFFSAGDIDGWLEIIDPALGWDISAHPLPDVSDHGEGRDAWVREFLGTYLSGWIDHSIELKEIAAVGDADVVLVLHETATMRGSGVPLDRDLVQLWTVRDGLMSFLRVFKTKEEALRAAASQGENVRLVRRNTDAYNAGDLDGFMDGWSSDAVVNWSNSRGFEAGIYRGQEEIRGFVQRFREGFEEIRIEFVDDPEEVQEGLVVAENVTYLRGRDGIEVEARSAWLIAFEDGEQTSLTMYQSKEDALSAAGLLE